MIDHKGHEIKIGDKVKIYQKVKKAGWIPLMDQLIDKCGIIKELDDFNNILCIQCKDYIHPWWFSKESVEKCISNHLPETLFTMD